MKFTFLSAAIITAVAVIGFTSCSDQAAAPAPKGPYFAQVKTIVQNNCISCHSQNGTGSPKGLPVLLETDDEIVQLSAQIKAATCDPVTIRNKRMPYGGELSSTEKQIIINWVNAGGTAAN